MLLVERFPRSTCEHSFQLPRDPVTALSSFTALQVWEFSPRSQANLDSLSLFSQRLSVWQCARRKAIFNLS